MQVQKLRGEIDLKGPAESLIDRRIQEIINESIEALLDDEEFGGVHVRLPVYWGGLKVTALAGQASPIR